MKKLLVLATCFFMVVGTAGCGSCNIKDEVVDENFYCKVIDEKNIAVGNVKTYPKSGAVFFPEKIENYTVSKIGFSSGLGFGGNGYLETFSENETNIKRCYFPHTIKEVCSGYMSLSGGKGTKVFYCGEIIDLGNLDVPYRAVEIYVPSEKYASFKEVLSEYFGGSLLTANVSYHLNYDVNSYYYIDYYENGEKILYIPPIPQRNGYTFGGWFKEADCINQWDFDNDTIFANDEIEEITLYAKWTAIK